MAASMLPSHLQGLQAALAVGVIVLTIKANEEAFLSFGEVPFFFFFQRYKLLLAALF